MMLMKGEGRDSLEVKMVLWYVVISCKGMTYFRPLLVPVSESLQFVYFTL